jgi:hypothetical protein
VKDRAGDFKSLWKDDGDPLDDVPVPAAKPRGEKGSTKEFVHEENLDELFAGMNATSIVWVRLLQLKRMRPKDRYHILGNEWLARYGVDRYAKYRALQQLRDAGLIRIHQKGKGSPRVKIIPRSQRVINPHIGRD